MLKGILSKIFGDKSAKDQKEFQPYVEKILQFANTVSHFSDTNDNENGSTQQ